MTLLADVLDAHGGLQRWEAASWVSVEVSSGGLAFTTKGQRRGLSQVRARISTTGQYVLLETPRATHTFDRHTPAPRGPRWSDHDIASFAATALWTYVSLPFVLPQLRVTERGNRLIVDFPPTIRTHSPRQVLHVDEEGLIVRHDYTALHFGRWAHASQHLGDYRAFGGLTHRDAPPRPSPVLATPPTAGCGSTSTRCR